MARVWPVLRDFFKLQRLGEGCQGTANVIEAPREPGALALEEQAQMPMPMPMLMPMSMLIPMPMLLVPMPMLMLMLLLSGVGLR